MWLVAFALDTFNWRHPLLSWISVVALILQKVKKVYLQEVTNVSLQLLWEELCSGLFISFIECNPSRGNLWGLKYNLTLKFSSSRVNFTNMKMCNFACKNQTDTRKLKKCHIPFLCGNLPDDMLILRRFRTKLLQIIFLFPVCQKKNH